MLWVLLLSAEHAGLQCIIIQYILCSSRLSSSLLYNQEMAMITLPPLTGIETRALSSHYIITWNRPLDHGYSTPVSMAGLMNKHESEHLKINKNMSNLCKFCCFINNATCIWWAWHSWLQDYCSKSYTSIPAWTKKNIIVIMEVISPQYFLLMYLTFW